MKKSLSFQRCCDTSRYFIPEDTVLSGPSCRGVVPCGGVIHFSRVARVPWAHYNKSDDTVLVAFDAVLNHG